MSAFGKRGATINLGKRRSQQPADKEFATGDGTLFRVIGSQRTAVDLDCP
jgi:hypothetical protein